MQKNFLDGTLEYTVKKHPRARHVKLKASLLHGLEVVVPVRFNLKNLPEILEKNKSWIQKKLADFSEKIAREPRDSLPDTITLAAIDQTFRIQYIKTASKKIVLFIRPDQELVIVGAIENKIKCKKLLTSWLKKQAKRYLNSRLKKISVDTRLTYKKLTVREQQTRWGSCSSDKSINLNYKLLFLPPHLADHVMIHELCHTAHLNHSQKFWELVASFDPNWKEHRQTLRRADEWVPMWVQ